MANIFAPGASLMDAGDFASGGFTGKTFPGFGGSTGPSALDWSKFGLGAAGQIASLFPGKSNRLADIQDAILRNQYNRSLQYNPIYRQLLGGAGEQGSIRNMFQPAVEASGRGLAMMEEAAGTLGPQTFEELVKEVGPEAYKFIQARQAAMNPSRMEAIRRLTEGLPSSIGRQQAISAISQQDLEDQLAALTAMQQYLGVGQAQRGLNIQSAGARAGIGQAMPGVAAGGADRIIQALLQLQA